MSTYSIKFVLVWMLMWLPKFSLIIANLISQSRSPRELLWPQYTVLQVNYAVVVPTMVPYGPFTFNMGFQLNYALPFNNSEAVNPWHWANRELKEPSYSGKSKRDYSAGEFYQQLREIFEWNGFHRDCLQKAICQLSEFPLDQEHDNLLTEILHFVFTPSSHKAFNEDEWQMQESLENAECNGRLSNCTLEYPNCSSTPLDLLSYIDWNNNDIE